MAGVPLNEIVRRMRRGVSECLDDVAAQFVDAGTRIIETEAVDTGDLKNNVYTKRPAWNRRTVTWGSKHAVFVHFGTRPHWPPLAPILAWVRRNLDRITLSDGSNGCSRPRCLLSPLTIVFIWRRTPARAVAKESA
jgi:hypothetical protein